MVSDSTFVGIRATSIHVENYRNIGCIREDAFLARSAEDNISLDCSRYKLAVITLPVSHDMHVWIGTLEVSRRVR
jgi:hypothetical protein